MQKIFTILSPLLSILVSAPCLAQPEAHFPLKGLNGSLELAGVSRPRDDVAKHLGLAKESGQYKLMVEKKWDRFNFGVSFSQRDIPSAEANTSVQTHMKIDSYCARGEAEVRSWNVSWAKKLSLDGRAEVGYAMYQVEMRDDYVTLKDKTTGYQALGGVALRITGENIQFYGALDEQFDYAKLKRFPAVVDTWSNLYTIGVRLEIL